MTSMIQEEIKARLCTDSFGENLAVMVYEAMRFERKGDTPDWAICGNSHAQNEARAVSARIVERFRDELRDLPDEFAGTVHNQEEGLFSLLASVLERNLCPVWQAPIRFQDLMQHIAAGPASAKRDLNRPFRQEIRRHSTPIPHDCPKQDTTL